MERNIGVTLQDLGLDSCLLNMAPKAQARKERRDKFDFIQIKTFCVSEDTIQKVKSKLQNGEKYLQIIYMIVTRIYKEFSRLNNKKTNKPIKKWANDLNRHFSKEDIQIANKHVKGCSTSLIIREMQIKLQ